MRCSVDAHAFFPSIARLGPRIWPVQLRDNLTHIEGAVLDRVIQQGGRLLGVSQKEDQVEHQVSHLGLLYATVFILVNRKIRKETVVGLEAEHVDCVSTFVKKSLVVLLHKLNRVLEECLRVQSVCVEVEREDGFVEDAVKPKRRFLSEDDLQ